MVQLNLRLEWWILTGNHFNQVLSTKHCAAVKDNKNMVNSNYALLYMVKMSTICTVLYLMLVVYVISYPNSTIWFILKVTISFLFVSLGWMSTLLMVLLIPRIALVLLDTTETRWDEDVHISSKNCVVEVAYQSKKITNILNCVVLTSLWRACLAVSCVYTSLLVPKNGYYVCAET